MPAQDSTLDWLLHWPAYRELIRQRISEEQKRRRSLDQKREASHARGNREAGVPPIDKLGREVEGCG
jgi:hypothetical protein